VAISTQKSQFKNHFLVRLCDRVKVPDWAVYLALVANFAFVLVLNNPILNAATLTIAISSLVGISMRMLFRRVAFGRRQLRTLRAIGVTISSSIATPLALLAQPAPTNGCQNAGILNSISQYAFQVLSNTPFLASWMCSQIAGFVVMALIGFSVVVIWVFIDSMMTQQPLTVYIKPALGLMLCVSLITGLSSLLLFSNGAGSNGTVLS
jgi:hypothetical protein